MKTSANPNTSANKYKSFSEIANESGDELLMAMNAAPKRIEGLIALTLLAVMDEIEAGNITLRPDDESVLLADPTRLASDAQHLFKVRYRLRHYINGNVRKKVGEAMGREFKAGKIVSSAVATPAVVKPNPAVVTATPRWVSAGEDDDGVPGYRQVKNTHAPVHVPAPVVEDLPAMYGSW